MNAITFISKEVEKSSVSIVFLTRLKVKRRVPFLVMAVQSMFKVDLSKQEVVTIYVSRDFRSRWR